MTDALERAARAIAVRHGVDPDQEGPGHRHAAAQDDGTTLIVTDHRGPLWKLWTRDARAAILAFLDASDEAMMKKVAEAYRAGTLDFLNNMESRVPSGTAIGPINDALAQAGVAAAIAALREMLEGEK